MTNNDLKPNLFFVPSAFILFFILSVFYFFSFAGYVFFYQEKSMLFQASFEFLKENLNQPGGFLVWLGMLQTAFYYYPLAGAIIVSSEILFVVYIISRIGKELTGSVQIFVSFFLGAVLFYLQTNYQFQAMNLIAILLQLIVFKVIVRSLYGKWGWIYILLFPLWYYLTGCFAFVLMFNMVLQLIPLKGKSNWLKLFMLIFITAIFIFLIREFLFFDSGNKLLFFPYANQNIGNQKILFFCTILAISFLPLIFKLKFKRIQSMKIRKVPVVHFSPFAIILITGVIAFFHYDVKNKHYFEVEKLFFGQNFDEVVAYNKKHPSTNILTGFLNNIALAETGKLNNELFSFPQSTDGKTLFLPWELSGEVLKIGGYYYYTLGIINEAQRWAYEYMVMRGLTPEGLKMLIKTELINGNFRMAEKYIAILKQSLFYVKEAQRFELILNDVSFENDKSLQRKLQLKAKQDFFVVTENPLANLDLILAADSTNQAAVQYKFAFLLLQKDFESVTKLLPMLKKAGFKILPKNIEEAVVAYSLLNLGKYPEFEYFVVKPETVIAFNRYYTKFQQNNNSKDRAEKALKEFSDTYWYHVFFR